MLTDFSRNKDPVSFLDDIRKNRITVEEAKDSQKDFNVYLKSIRKANKTPEHEKTLATIKLFNGRNDAIAFIESYGPKILESKRLAREGTGFEI